MKNRYSGIDRVRAYAALYVVWVHTVYLGLPNVANNIPSNLGIFRDVIPHLFPGTPAVIAFFVISGFCIHFPYTDRSLPFWQFWLARWIRISPPLLAAFLAAKIVGIPKFNFIDGVVLWSIVCELMYYTLYPGFFIISRVLSWKSQFYIAFVVSSLLVFTRGNHQDGLYFQIANYDNFGPYQNWLVALPSWLAGCVLAEQTQSKSLRAFEINVIIWRILIVVAAFLLMWPPIKEVLGCYPSLNAFSLFVFFWLNAEISVEQRKHSIFESVGKWSYSLYLFHVIILVFLLKCFKWLNISGYLNDIEERLVALPFVLFFSFLAYVLFERKSHHYARLLYKKYSPMTSWSHIHRK